jgi:hypothetical protein
MGGASGGRGLDGPDAELVEQGEHAGADLVADRAHGLDEIDDVLPLIAHADDYRSEYDTVRPHEAIAWNRPLEVHLGLDDPMTPSSPETQNLPAA